MPEGVCPAPVKLIQTIIENKFTDTGIEKTLQKNYGNAYRDTIREVHVEIDSAETRRTLDGTSKTAKNNQLDSAETRQRP